MKKLVIEFVLIVGIFIVGVRDSYPSAAAQSDEATPFVMYYNEAAGEFIVERADGSERRVYGAGRIPENERYVEYFAWSPSGEWLAWTYGEATNPPPLGVMRRVQVVNVDGATYLEGLADVMHIAYNGVLWSPTADVLFVYQQSYARNTPVAWYLFDAGTDSIITQGSETGMIEYAVWSRDGRYVALQGTEALVVISADGREVLRDARMTAMGMLGEGNIAWLPDGRLAYPSQDNNDRLIVVDLATQAADYFRLPVASITDVYWSPNEAYALLREPLSRDAFNVWLYIPSAAEPLQVLTEEPLFSGDMAGQTSLTRVFIQSSSWSPNSQHAILVIDHLLYRYDRATQTLTEILLPSSRDYNRNPKPFDLQWTDDSQGVYILWLDTLYQYTVASNRATAIFRRDLPPLQIELSIDEQIMAFRGACVTSEAALNGTNDTWTQDDFGNCLLNLTTKEQMTLPAIENGSHCWSETYGRPYWSDVSMAWVMFYDEGECLGGPFVMSVVKADGSGWRELCQGYIGLPHCATWLPATGQFD